MVAVAGIGGLADGGDWSLWPQFLPLWALAAFLMFRAWRMEVVRSTRFVVVRGHLWTRRIPSTSIAAVSDFPAIHWQHAAAHHRTPLLMFWTTNRMLEPVRHHAAREVQRLRRSLGVGTSADK